MRKPCVTASVAGQDSNMGLCLKKFNRLFYTGTNTKTKKGVMMAQGPGRKVKSTLKYFSISGKLSPRTREGNRVV